MKATVSTAALEQALQFVVAEKCDTLPILNRTVALKAEKKHLSVYSTDLEITMLARIPAEVFEEGGAVVSKAMIKNYLSKKSDTVVLHCWDKKETRIVDEKKKRSEAGGKLHVTSKDVQGWIEDMEISQYPVVELGKWKEFVFLGNKAVDVIANCISQFAARSSLRPVLSGILINEKIAVATDSYTLGEYIHDPTAKLTYDPEKSPTGIIVPTKPFKHLHEHCVVARIDVNDKRNFARYRLENDSALEDFGVEYTIYSRIIEGNFPNYQQVMMKKKDRKARLIIPRDDLLKAVKRIHPIAKEINNNIRYEVKKDDSVLTLSSKHMHGAMSVNIQLKDEVQEDVITALSSEYVLHAISTLEGDFVEMDFQSALHAAEFRVAGEEGRTLLVMPLRLSED